MKYWWWKILAIAIFSYVLLAGMLTPLKSGIYSVDKTKGVLGAPLTLQVETYNTYMSSALQNVAFLKLSDNKVIRSTSIIEKNDFTAQINFDLPASLSTGKSSERATLIINNEVDGSMILPNAILLKEEGNIAKQTSSQWTTFDVASLFPNKGFRFPYRNKLHETIRNTFFHIAIWFAMFILLIIALVYSIRYLSSKDLAYDYRAAAFTNVSIFFGIIGLASGAVWAKFTWGAFWTADVKLNMAAISVLIYAAYWMLRSSIRDVDAKARVAAAYNIFAFVVMIPLIFIIPRLTDSLHPGNGGNPALGGEDLDNTLRMIFYPSIIALTLIGLWMANLTYRLQIIHDKTLEE